MPVEAAPAGGGSSLLPVLPSVIGVGIRIAATVPGEKQRSLISLREFSWQGKACSAERRASQEPGSASAGAKASSTQAMLW